MILSKTSELNLRARELGGKAWRLIELQTAGLPVPAFFVVTPEDFCSPEQIAAWEWPPDTITRIKYELGLLSGESFAVRSSAIDEDGEVYSFAGQLRTHLNQRSLEDVLAAIKDVWASAFSATALDYRRQRGLKIGGAPIVIVQKMIAAEVSGVLFTADPVSGNYHKALLSFAAGLGDAVVDGRADCTEVSVNLKTQTLQKTGRSSPLSDSQILAVTRLGLQIAELYQAPQDIEWCWCDGRLYIVQTRPITSESIRRRQSSSSVVFDNSNIQESFCGITLPLTFSFASYAYYQVYSQLMAMAGFSSAEVARHDARHRNMLSYVDGRVFYNIQSWYDGLKLLPSFGRNKEDMERMMGVQHPVDFVQDETLSLLQKIRVLPKLFRTLGVLLWNFARIEKLFRQFTAGFDRQYAELKVEEIYRLDAAETLMAIRQAKTRFLGNWSAPILNDFYVMVYNGKVRRALTLKGLEAEQPALLVGEDLASTAPTKALLKLAAEIRENPELREWLLAQSDATEVLRQLQWRSPETAADLKNYICEFGDRVVGELKLESEALWQNPTFLLDVLKSYLSQAVEPLEKREAQTRRAAEERVFAQLPSKRFRRDLQRLRDGVRFRESMRFKRTRAFGIFRRFYVHLGEVLAKQGALSSARDIFYLTESEIEAFIEARSTHQRLQPLIALRRQEFQALDHREPPSHFRAAIPLYTQMHREIPTAKKTNVLPGQWRGIGCYAGIVRAQVVVLTEPSRDISLHGKILCTLRTDPGWAPLFVNLAGLLVEKGSTLSHSAVVARELGLPVVVGAPGVTSELKTGDWIELNGSSGEIQALAPPILEENENENSALTY
jgi:rifampicin phosphotransferase